MIIRIDHPVTLSLACEQGDELHVKNPSQALLSLLATARPDGSRLARRVSEDEDADDEVADAERGDMEVAVTGQGKGRRGRRSATVS